MFINKHRNNDFKLEIRFVNTKEHFPKQGIESSLQSGSGIKH